MAAPSTRYEPRCPAHTALYQIVRDHVETFRAQAARLREGEGLPRFVEHAAVARSAMASRAEALAEAGVPELSAVWLARRIRPYVAQGFSPASGFAQFRCHDCGLDRLVPFSCKARAICSSCGGRRMTERAAHLLDHVFPDVPVRQAGVPGAAAALGWSGS